MIVTVHSERYDSYIRSEEWKRKAQEARDRYKHRCAVCNRDWKSRNVPLDVHHYRYRNDDGEDLLGIETMRDLCCLCRTHHPVGAYSKSEVKRDRRTYLLRKYRRKVLLLPLWPLKILWGIARGKIA